MNFMSVSVSQSCLPVIRIKPTVFLVGEVDLKFRQVTSNLEPGKVWGICDGELDREGQVDLFKNM